MSQKQYTKEELTQLCTQIRRDIVRMVYNVQSGHPGGSLGCVEYLVNLYFRILRHHPQKFEMNGIGEDLFFLSNGHISPVYYSTLARAGFFPVEELNTFRKLDSRLQGHPATAEHLEGIRIASGSLGQGLSVAVGAAHAKKLNNDPHLVYVLCGDGEMQEGQIWEAAMFAAHHQTDNLIVTVDLNFKQIDGDTRDVINTDSLAQKWRAFNWTVLEETNGNDLDAVHNVLLRAKEETGKGKPVVIMLHTVMGKGVDFMEDKHEWHGSPPNKDQFEKAMAQLELTLADF